MIMKRLGRKNDDRFFPDAIRFWTPSLKVADPKTRDHIGVGAFNMIRRPVTKRLGPISVCFEVLDDMKLGKW